MEKQKEHKQNYSGGNIYPSKEGTYQLSRVRKNKGRWSFEEHQAFVNCLKRYGNNPQILQEMIPTRTSTQIKSHSQKYFDQIKKDYKTNNPMEFVLKNMCDATPLYQFELPDRSQLDEKSLMLCNSDSDSKYLPMSMKKRDLKYADKSLKDSISSLVSMEKSSQKNYRASSSISLVKTARSSECITESAPNSDPHSGKDMKQESTSSRQGLSGEKVATQLKAKKGCSIMGLNQGKVLIQVDKMQSSVPFKCKQVSRGVSMFLPQDPCMIFMMPLNQANPDIPASLSKPELPVNNKERKILKNKDESVITNPSYFSNLNYGGAYQTPQTAHNNEYLEVLECLEQIFCLSPYHN
ncbi:unnamed protein product [Moneuplotes crassus]|uniref:HTH myb-type domain-containing protein n=1 Tax=Euplotes crassus TaxID=5936 RepID=A0AAD1XLZ7_EUPCR|nr:unnamed protein product [Moneuplotes crassus]